MLLWGWKQRGLYKYIMACADNPDAWEFTISRAVHRPSKVGIWMGNGFWFVDIYDGSFSGTGDQKIGFSLVQKWKIHRKLKKIKQKLERAAEVAKRDGYETKVDYWLGKMIGGTWGGGSE